MIKLNGADRVRIDGWTGATLAETDGGSALLTFGGSITADYAIAFADNCCGGFAGLWQLQNGGPHNFIKPLTKNISRPESASVTRRPESANAIELSGLTIARSRKP